MNSRFLMTEALVVGSLRYGEADRILTLYTRDRGRIGAIAKGVRRPKSKTGGRLEPFSLVRVNLYAGRTLYTVVGTETLRTFQGVRDELFRIEQGARLLNAIRHLFPEEEANVPAFNLLVRAVAQLAQARDVESASSLVLATRLKLLALLGYGPSTFRCVLCESESPPYAFCPALGGVVCGTCAQTATETCFSLTGKGLEVLRVLLQEPLAAVDTFGLDQQALAEVEQVVTQTFAYHGY